MYVILCICTITEKYTYKECHLNIKDKDGLAAAGENSLAKSKKNSAIEFLFLSKKCFYKKTVSLKKIKEMIIWFKM